MLKKTFALFCLLLAILLAWPFMVGMPDADPAFELGLDLAGGTMVTYRPDLENVPDHSAGLPEHELLDLAKQTLASRLAQRFDTLPDVVVRGDQRIVVSLPGEHDQRRVLETMGETYRLSFRPALSVDDEKPANPQGLLGKYQARWLDLGEEVASGDMLDPRSIRVSMPDSRSPEGFRDGAVISFGFRPPFDDLFAEITAANVGNTLAILLDDEVEWAGVVSEEIRGPGVLRGGYDMEQASEVASLLRSGNLPLGLDVESLWAVGPTLGEELLESGRAALGWSALALAVLLALAYGRRPALLATGLVSLGALLFFTVGLISALGLTVDLIAIAGLVLSIGMGMDAFILVFEALEQRGDESSRPDVRSPLGRLKQVYGFRGEGRTLVHANATTLLVVLLLFASERLQSFALFLVVGMAASLLTLVVTRELLRIFARRGWLEDAAEAQKGGRNGGLRGLQPRIFLRRRIYFAAVGLFFLASTMVFLRRDVGPWLRLGADFQPGVQMQVASAPEQIVPLVDDLRAAFPDTQVRHQTLSTHASMSQDAGPGTSGTPGAASEHPSYLVTLEGAGWQGQSLTDLGPQLDRHGAELESIQSIDARLSARRILGSLSVLVLSFVCLGFYLGPVQSWVDHQLLGPVRGGSETASSGRAALLGTVAAVVLDVAAVLTALALLGIPLGMPELAALLTIIGYSVNDSMVLWSHLTRPEPDESRAGESEKERITRVVDRVLGRTVLTSLSTMIPALAILATGLEPLRGFAWAVVVGTISGSLSSIFVVAAIVAASFRRDLKQSAA